MIQRPRDGVRGRLVSAALALVAAGTAHGQLAIDGIEFTDRTMTGEMQFFGNPHGLAIFDFDGDGWMDFFFGANNDVQKALYRNVADPNRPGQRTFRDVLAGSGLDGVENLQRRSNGVVVADYDNDGDPDLYTLGTRTSPTNYGLLFSNDGDGTFTDVTVAAGLRINGGGAIAAGWSDYDLDADADLFITLNLGPQQILLYRNNGDGTFTGQPDRLPIVTNVSTTYANLWTDYDQDGWPDCIVTSNVGPYVVLHNIPDPAGGRRFENTAAALGYGNLGPAPMGIAGGDYDGDGDIDVAISNGVDGVYFRNDGGTALTQVNLVDSVWGWGISWTDVDNDADLDLYTAGSWPNSNFDRLHRNLGDGTFDDISGVLNGPLAASRWSVQVDYNNDGRMDFITQNLTGSLPISVYDNVTTSANHWLRLHVRGDGRFVSRDALGAFIRVHAGGRTQVRELYSGTATTSSEDPRPHFGLADATTVDWIEVRWPRRGTLAGRTERFDGPFAADQMIALEPAYVPGDVDLSGVVDLDDLLIVLGDFGCSGAGCAGDDNGDGAVDLDDLLAVLGHFGEVR